VQNLGSRSIAWANSIGLLRSIGPSPRYVGGLVLVSLCYVLLRWLLEFVALRERSKEFGDAAALASTLGREAMDARASSRASADAA